MHACVNIAYLLKVQLHPHILQRLLGLNLHNRNQRVVGLQQILGLRDVPHRAHGKRAAKPSLPHGRELGRLDQPSRVVCRVEEGNDDAVGTGVKRAYTYIAMLLTTCTI